MTDEPAIPFDGRHPGVIFHELFLHGKLSTAAAAKRIGVAPRELRSFADGASAITQALADGISRKFGGTAYRWIKAQRDYDVRCELVRQIVEAT